MSGAVNELLGSAMEILDRREASDERAGRAGSKQGVAGGACYRYRKRIRLVAHSGGATASTLVTARSISSHGLAFLSDVPLYDRAKCTAILQALDAVLVPALGRIVRYQQVVEGIFEAGVAFDVPIDVRSFVSVDQE